MRFFRRAEPARRRANVGRSAPKLTLTNYYSGAKPPPDSPKKSAGRLPFSAKLRPVGHLLVGLAIIAGSLNFLYLNNNPRVSFVTLPEQAVTAARPGADYITYVNQILKASWLNHSKLTINTRSLEEQIYAKFPELESVNIGLPVFSSSPAVYLKHSEIALLLDNGSGVFAIDIRGKAVALIQDVPDIDLSSLPLVSDQSRPEITLRRTVLGAEDSKFIKTIFRQLKDNNLQISSMTIPALPNELHVRLVGVSYLTKYNLKTDARGAVGTFLAVRAKLEADKVTPAEYVDVRVDERAYYK